MTKLALGTAQFGMKYGVANAGARVSSVELLNILNSARQHHIDTLDTAMLYGEAEANLGAAGVTDFNIVTKLSPLPADVEDVRSWVVAKIVASLGLLNCPSVDAVLLHRSQEIIGSRADEIQAGLADAIELGLCRQVGVSIYAPDELDAIWGHASGWKPALVQAPFNAFDARIENSGWLDRMADAGIRVHTRSAFLQGLLLMPATDRPKYFDPFAPILDNWHNWCDARSLSPLAAALAFACGDDRIEKTVIGVDTAEQLDEVVDTIAGGPEIVPLAFSTENLDLIDPSRWKIS